MLEVPQYVMERMVLGVLNCLKDIDDGVQFRRDKTFPIFIPEVWESVKELISVQDGYSQSYPDPSDLTLGSRIYQTRRQGVTVQESGHLKDGTWIVDDRKLVVTISSREV